MGSMHGARTAYTSRKSERYHEIYKNSAGKLLRKRFRLHHANAGIFLRHHNCRTALSHRHVCSIDGCLSNLIARNFTILDFVYCSCGFWSYGRTKFAYNHLVSGTKARCKTPNSLDVTPCYLSDEINARLQAVCGRTKSRAKWTKFFSQRCWNSSFRFEG